MFKFVMLALAYALCSAPASAQDYPVKPIRIIVPFGPGGGGDIVGRIFGQSLQEKLGQPVIIENKPGQGTNIGAEAVARADPDGYTMLVAASSTAANKNLYRSLKYDLVSDLAPVSRASIRMVDSATVSAHTGIAGSPRRVAT